jgi:hypothetical protein
MHPIELQSYKLKIEQSKDLHLNDTLTQIVTLGDFPTELLTSLINALKMGEHVLPETLCSILISTKSKDLYQMALSHGSLGNWELVRLLENGFPSRDIETKLCGELYKCFKDDSQPLRSAIVKAMSFYGGAESLKLLEVIEYELAPTIPVRKYDLTTTPSQEAAIEDIIEAMELNSSEGFLQKLREAKEKISNTLKSNLPVSEGEQFASPAPPIFDRISTLQQRAKEYLSTDPESSLNNARKVAEVICKDLYITSGLEATSKRPYDSFKQLEELINTLEKNKIITNSILIHLNTMQHFGNFGSHDQGQESIAFTSEMAEPCLKALDTIIKWFKESRNAKP